MHKSIRKKLIIYIVPIVLLLLIVGCTVGIVNSKKIMSQQMYQEMISKQSKQIRGIENKISEIRSTSDTFSYNIRKSYEYLSLDTYKEVLIETVTNNDTLNSCAIWFEPYTIDPYQEYQSVYVSIEDGILSSSEYDSVEDYDYFNNELYKRCKETNESFFSQVNYNSLTDSYYIVYVTPIQNDNGEFIGCISSKFSMDELKLYIDTYAYDLINFYIVNSDGVYIAHDDTGLVLSHAKMLDTNEEFKDKVQTILDTRKGSFTYKKNNEKYYMYYNTFDPFEWKLVYEIPASELTNSTIQIIVVNIIIFAVTMCAIFASIYFFSNKFIHKPFKLLLAEFEKISEGDLNSDITQQLLKNDTEFSEVGEALMCMKQNLNDYKNELESKNKLLEENEKALTETVNYTKAVINTLPIMMFVFDRNGYCMEAHGTDQFNNRQANYYKGKHPYEVLGEANKESKDLTKFLEIIKTIDFSDGIVRIELPVVLYGNVEVFEHSISLCRENEVISLCRRTTDTVNHIENMRFLSNYDELTGAFNTRSFNEILRNYSFKERLPISIVILDVNGLKAINNEYGHDVCDKLLVELTNTLNKIDSPDKVVARIAGDEFAVVLPDTTKEKAENIFEEINAQCLSTIVFKVPFSISFGVETATTENDFLLDLANKAEELLYKQKVYTSSGKKDNTIELINSTLLAKNKREQLHSNRVSELCVEMAKVLGWSKLEQNKIKIAGLLHDIGKIGISDALLNKPGKLTDEEYAELQTHPEIGHRILQSSANMKELSEYAYAHHEKWDGTGYPRRLKGDEIVIEARIIAIIDTYDAITSSRSYRDGLPKEVAIKELIRCKNTQFDPELVDIFVEKVLNEKLENYQV